MSRRYNIALRELELACTALDDATDAAHWAGSASTDHLHECARWADDCHCEAEGQHLAGLRISLRELRQRRRTYHIMSRGGEAGPIIRAAIDAAQLMEEVLADAAATREPVDELPTIEDARALWDDPETATWEE